MRKESSTRLLASVLVSQRKFSWSMFFEKKKKKKKKINKNHFVKLYESSIESLFESQNYEWIGGKGLIQIIPGIRE